MNTANECLLYIFSIIGFITLLFLISKGICAFIMARKEQKCISGTVNRLDKQSDEHYNSICELRNDLDNFTISHYNKYEDLDIRLDSLEEFAESVNEAGGMMTREDLSEQIEKLDKRIDMLLETYTRLSGQVNNYEASMEKFRADISMKFSDLSERIAMSKLINLPEEGDKWTITWNTNEIPE